jgi:putative SOS response-associated peptidase YedK
MCGRFFILASPRELADLFGLADVPDVAPRYNVAPTQPVMAVGLSKEGRPAAATFRWSIVPPWATDPKPGPINARSETVADKPTFAEAIRKRRCLIPSSGFFEWLRQGKAKQPFAFRMADDRPFAFAGIWEAWRPESGPPLLTCAILTTAANELVRPVHDRMPVILDPRHYGAWIDRDVQEPAELAPMLQPFAADRMRAFPVSPVVNNPKNDDARCIEPA